MPQQTRVVSLSPICCHTHIKATILDCELSGMPRHYLSLPDRMSDINESKPKILIEVIPHPRFKGDWLVRKEGGKKR